MNKRIRIKEGKMKQGFDVNTLTLNGRVPVSINIVGRRAKLIYPNGKTVTVMKNKIKKI
jgi:hypothetical protein